MQHHGHARQAGHQTAWNGQITAQTNDHIRLHTLHHGTRLRKSLEQLERQLQHGLGALATHTAKLDQLQCKALRRNDARLHGAWRTQPVHIPAARAQLLGHGQAGEDMAASAAGHDQCGAWLVLLNRKRHA